MLHSCETTETMSKDAPCVLVTVEKQPSEMTQPLSAASPQTSQVGLFVSGVCFVLLGILSVFSVLAVQITIPKYKEIPGQFTSSSNGLNISTKHTVMCFNLLLIISAADKKKIKKQQQKTNTHFST